MLGAVAIGNLTSGLLATINLRLPFIAAGIFVLIMFGIVLTFKEPQNSESAVIPVRMSYGEILRQSVAILRERPTLRYALAFLTLVPVTSLIMETVFLQPQAVALGVPIAGIGVVIMAAQLMNMTGSTLSHRAKALVGEKRILYVAPGLVLGSLLLLAAFQTLPALIFATSISFFSAILRPIIMSRVQNEVTDNIRATVLSMQSLIFALVLAIGEPLLGLVADKSGLPASYVVLATTLALLFLALFWRGRHRFP
jgi:predicted MFS family arabinose efflux permease